MKLVSFSTLRSTVVTVLALVVFISTNNTNVGVGVVLAQDVPSAAPVPSTPIGTDTHHKSHKPHKPHPPISRYPCGVLGLSIVCPAKGCGLFSRVFGYWCPGHCGIFGNPYGIC